jgi:hypothetical protein
MLTPALTVRVRNSSPGDSVWVYDLSHHRWGWEDASYLDGSTTMTSTTTTWPREALDEEDRWCAIRTADGNQWLVQSIDVEFMASPHDYCAECLPDGYDAAKVGTCDICDQVYVLGSDDHNPDTGNHHDCEATNDRRTPAT